MLEVATADASTGWGKDPKDPTEVGQKVGSSHNGVNRPTDKPGPQNRTAGQSRICLCIVESNVA